MKNITIVLAMLPAVLVAQSNFSTEDHMITTAQFRNIQDSIVSKIDKGVIPSFSVAVSKAGKVIWIQSFGWADKENKIKATTSTSYALASLSKSITSTALMILVEKGLVNLNDPVDKYLKGSKLTYYKGNPSQLTIGHLINMAGGVPHQWEYYYYDENKQPTSIEEQVKRYGIVVFSPGEVFCYSNFSPAIVELIIKNVTGKNLAEFMREMVFAPLDMKNASVNRNKALSKHFTKGYDVNGNLLSESEFYPTGGAGYYASIDDLLKYGMFHLKNRINGRIPILKDANVDQLHLPIEYTSRNKYYADGWGVLKLEKGMSTLLSNGAIDGTASSLLLLPDSNIAIACLTNATVGNDFTDQVAFNIADILLAGYLNELRKFFETNAPAFSDQPFHAVDSLIGTWKGAIVTYQDSIPFQMIIDRNNKIFIHVQGQFETLLNNVVVNSGLIQGQCYGNIALPETNEIPHYLEIVLKPGSHEMYGSISAQSFQTKRPYFMVPSYLWLRKTAQNN